MLYLVVTPLKLKASSVLVIEVDNSLTSTSMLEFGRQCLARWEGNIFQPLAWRPIDNSEDLVLSYTLRLQTGVYFMQCVLVEQSVQPNFLKWFKYADEVGASSVALVQSGSSDATNLRMTYKWHGVGHPEPVWGYVLCV